MIDTATIDQARADQAPESELCAACRECPVEIDDMCGHCWSNAYDADRFAAAVWSDFEIAGYNDGEVPL